MALKLGDAAPDFELMDESLQRVSLKSLRGKKVVLLFYPMDFSPVCTVEHCTFGPEVDRIANDGNTVVFGVNCDSPFSHAAFRKQYNIPYSLLSDPTRAMVKAYDMFGGLEPFNCAKRGTVIIDADGKIAYHQVADIDQPRELMEIIQAAQG